MNWRNVIKPGCIDERVRVIYFFMFMGITIIQTWLALRMEQMIADENYDEKYPEIKPF